MDRAGGDDPYRYRGEIRTSGTGQTKYVVDNGSRVALMKPHRGPNGPEWHPMKKGRLRFKPMNRFEVRIPAIGHAKDRTFEDVVIITDQMLANSPAYDRKLDTTEDLRNMFRYTHTHAARDHETQKAFILEALQAYAANRYPQKWRAGGGEITLSEASDCYWILDIKRLKSGEGIQYDWQTTYYAGDRPHTDTILNRTLRGVAWIPVDMARQMGLIPQARIDLEGFCVPVQMQLCVTRRYRPSDGGGGSHGTEPMFSIEEMKEFLEQIYELVHGPRPGKQATVHQQPTAQEQAKLGPFYEAWADVIQVGKACEIRSLMKQAKYLRKGPYQQPLSFTDALRKVYPNEYVEGRCRRYFQAFFQVDGDKVRQRLPIVEPIDQSPGQPGGISAAVIVEFCKLVRIPCHVIHKDHTTYEWLPDGYEHWNRDQIRDTARVTFNVYGDHAFF